MNTTTETSALDKAKRHAMPDSAQVGRARTALKKAKAPAKAAKAKADPVMATTSGGSVLTDREQAKAMNKAWGTGAKLTEVKTKTKPAPVPRPAPKAEKVAKAPKAKPTPRSEGKTARMIALLSQTGGATMAAMSALSGWNEQSIKWFMAGTLKKKGLTVVHSGEAEARIYRIEPAEAV